MSRIETLGDSLDPYEPHDEHRHLIRSHPMIDSRKLSHTDLQTDLDNALLYTEKLLAMNMPRENLAALRKVVEAARLVADPNIPAAMGRFYKLWNGDNDLTLDEIWAEAVAAALTPPGEDE